jgi:hypothetical protein
MAILNFHLRGHSQHTRISTTEIYTEETLDHQYYITLIRS